MAADASSLLYPENVYAPDSASAGLPSLRWRRPDKKSKTGLESLESRFGAMRIPRSQYSPGIIGTGDAKRSGEDVARRSIEALRAARELGYKLPKEVYDPQYLAAMLMQEGRADFGAGSGFGHNKEATKLADILAGRFGSEAGAFVGSVYDKSQVAQRTKKPFPMVWNGVGVARNYDGSIAASGKNYAERFPMFYEAAGRPENAELRNFVNEYLTGTEYTSPLLPNTKRQFREEYERRQRETRKQASQKLSSSPLRDLQYTFFGGKDRLLGVPAEYDPVYQESQVKAPDYEKLGKTLRPTYNAGGMIENTTHDRKIL